MARSSGKLKIYLGPTPPASRSPASDGFSLLEVLVATTIMGLVLVVLLQVLTSALRSQETSWGYTQAVLVAEKILDENCKINTLKAGTYQGRDGRYDYMVRVTPQYELASPLSNLQVQCSLIQVTLAWQERGARKTLELQTLRTGAQRGSL
jgi:prepilin-type N-terminal cleavage/methylation domain-containing protein